MLSVTKFLQSGAVAVAILGASACMPEDSEQADPSWVDDVFDEYKHDAPITVTIDPAENGTSNLCSFTQTWDELYPDDPSRELRTAIAQRQVIAVDFKHSVIEGELRYLVVPSRMWSKVLDGPIHLWVAPWGGRSSLECGGDPLQEFWVATQPIPTTSDLPIEEAILRATKNLDENGLRSLTEVDLSNEKEELPPGAVDIE